MRHEIIDASQLELTDKVVSIKRVTKVTKGGNTMRFTALVVVGDMNGHVGVGLGKAKEIPEAIRKGKEDATKKLVTVVRDENNSIPHDNLGKFGSASVLLKKSPEGTGIIAGGPARAVVWAPTISRTLYLQRSQALQVWFPRKMLLRNVANPWMRSWRKEENEHGREIKNHVGEISDRSDPEAESYC